MNNSQKYNDQAMPELVALDKKPAIRKNSQSFLRSKPQETKSVQNPVAAQASSVKMQEQQRINSKKKDDFKKQRSHEIQKSNEHSKNLIAQMINKISLRSTAQQSYPVSNQTIEKLLFDLEEQINIVSIEAGKFQNSLLLNPTNQHIKKELQAVQKSLNQMKTIKQLYKEKIQNRNKITQLQSKIMALKNENRELKIKIARGIQKIESHIHNLPCEKEKELIEEVNKYKLSLHRQKEMRENLQNNISSIVFNFKRFYIEADQARKIVTQQLKTLSRKENQMNLKLQNLNQQQRLKHGMSNADLKSVKVQSNLESSQPFFRQRKLTNRLTDQQNMAEIINIMNIKEKQMKHQKDHYPKKGQKAGLSHLGSTILNKQLSESNQFTLQEQIQKMRANQQTFKKMIKKPS